MRVLPTHPFALRRVLDLAGVSHGRVADLDARERNNLLAYLLCL